MTNYLNKNLVIDQETQIYSRYNHKQNDMLKIKLNNSYNCSNCLIANSGLNANYIIFHSLIDYYKGKHFNIIYIGELYHETIQLINSLESYPNINLIKYDLLNMSIIELFNSKLTNQNNIIFIESCTNPHSLIFDFCQIEYLRSISKKLHIICDNSWLSHCIFNPFEHDIDIVTISLTKYYSGGNAICGACLFKSDDIYNLADNFIRISGLHNSPLQIQIINKYIENMDIRLSNSSELTKKLIEHIESLSNKIIINHPLIKNHPMHTLATKYFKNNLYLSTFTIGFNINNEELLKIINNLTILQIETSFGSNLTKIDNYVNTCDDLSFIRISVGYDDNIQRIINGINELINSITAGTILNDTI